MSTVAVKDGRLVTLGDLGGIEQIICLNVADGSRVWAKQPEPVAKELESRVALEFKELDRDSNGRISELEALVCMDFETGKIRWQARTVGKGSIVAAGDMLYLVSEGHEIAFVEADPEKFRP